MKDGHFRPLFLSMLAAFGLLAGANAADAGAIPSMAAGGAPLVLYHLGYLYPRARRGISQAAIDSVYYFGFLITVAALGISAVSVAGSWSSASVSQVLYQFGVGLFATGYAVVARMHLSSISALVDDSSPEAMLDRYILRSREMLDNVETAGIRTSDLGKTILEKTSEISIKARDSAETAILGVARAFEQEMRTVLSGSHAQLVEIRRLTAETAFAAERSELAASLRQSLDVTKAMNAAMATFAANAARGATEADRVAASWTSVDGALQQLTRTLGPLAGPEGALASATTTLGDTSVQIAQTAGQLGVSIRTMADLGADAAAASQAFKNLKLFARKAQEQLEATGALTQKMDQILASMGATVTSIGTLSTQTDQATQVLARFGSNTEAVGQKFSSLASGAEGMTRQLAAIPSFGEELKVTLKALQAGIASISDSIGSAARDAASLKANAGESAQILATTNQHLNGTSKAAETVTRLNEQMGGLAIAVTSVQAALAASSQDIQRAVASSTQVLVSDAQTSSAAVNRLTESLVRVANTVIEQTQRRQGGPG